jgi:hypothetical protein
MKRQWFSSFKKKLIDEAIVSHQNLPFWSDEATEFPSCIHISVDVAIVSLQNPPLWSDTFRKIVDTIKRSVSISEDRTVGPLHTFAASITTVPANTHHYSLHISQQPWKPQPSTSTLIPYGAYLWYLDTDTFSARLLLQIQYKGLVARCHSFYLFLH